MKKPDLTAIIFAAVGACLLLGSAFLHYNRFVFVQSSLKAEGKVVSLDKKTGSGSSNSIKSYVYAPVVEFTTSTKSKITFTASAYSSDPGYAPGDSVKVYYSPTNFEDATIASFFHMWGILVITYGLGVLFFAIGFSLIYFPWRKHRNQQWLIENGIQSTGKVISMEKNTRISSGGRNPILLKVQCTDPLTGSPLELKSHNIWKEVNHNLVESEVSVFFHKTNSKRFHIDI